MGENVKRGDKPIEEELQLLWNEIQSLWDTVNELRGQKPEK